MKNYYSPQDNSRHDFQDRDVNHHCEIKNSDVDTRKNFIEPSQPYVDFQAGISQSSSHQSSSQPTDFTSSNEYDVENINYPARIAVYDAPPSTPRVVTIEPCGVHEYLSKITETTYTLSKQQGGTLPFSVIRELVENFIHAYFIEPTISIMDGGNTIKFTDQGPGIPDITQAQQVGVTSATHVMKKYIRGVGSGLPVVRDHLDAVGGVLSIENNIKAGTVVTISSITPEEPSAIENILSDSSTSQLTQNTHNNTDSLPQFPFVDERELQVLTLTQDLLKIGPTELTENLQIPSSTGYRILKSLEEKGLLEVGAGGDKKRSLTDLGHAYLSGAHIYHQINPNG